MKDGKVFAYIGGTIPEDILQRTKVVRVYLLVGSEKIYAGDHKVNKYPKNVFVSLNADVIEVFSKDSPEVTAFRTSNPVKLGQPHRIAFIGPRS